MTCASVFVSMDCTVLEMEDKPFSVDSSDDINIEEEEDEINDDSHSRFLYVFH